MMSYRFLVVFLIAVLQLQTSAVCAEKTVSAPLQGKLFTMHGSNTLGAKLAPSWAKQWLGTLGVEGTEIYPLGITNEYRVQGDYRGNPVYIDIRAHGSSTGFRALDADTTDIALASRSIKDDEVITLAKLGNMRSFNAEHVVAIDGLAVIVNPRNTINAIRMESLGKIFSGEITNWSQLGGLDLPISVHARDNNSGTWDTFKSLVLRKKYTLTDSAQRFESNDELSDQVSSQLGAIGFVGLASVRQAKALAISDNGSSALKPAPLFVATEDYPLARRLFMYTPETIVNPWVSEFINFAKNAQGQDTVQEIGFVSLNPVSLKLQNQFGPTEYQSLAQYAERLSINFRFQGTDARLDNKARQDVLRLREYVEQIEPGMRIQLVGFSNTYTTETRSEVLSRLRASAIKIELFKHGLAIEPVLGYGADLLVASNNGENSIKNNRVEVWVFRDEDKNAYVNSRKAYSREEQAISLR